MWDTLKNAFKIVDLRKKILYTLLMLVIYRLCGIITVPGINIEAVKQTMSNFSILGILDGINGGNLGNFTIFAMGVTPYINASIIMQLLTVAIPQLEAMQKEGDEGRKKIAQITRYAAVGLAFIQAIGMTVGMGAAKDANWFSYITIAITLSAGTAFVMWIGERITENGIGNGMSMLIFAGIVSRLPVQIYSVIVGTIQGVNSIWFLPGAVVGAIILCAGVVFIDMGERRIPVQYAKRQVGRKMYGGQSTHIPMKVNSSGVLPLIFASSIITFPGMIAGFWPTSWFYVWYNNFTSTSWWYLLIFALMIVFFTYFYTTISFNPIEVAKNMQQYGGMIPGIRQGKPTSDFLSRISTRITLFGALFLAVLASLPFVFSKLFGIQFGFGPTSILIAVSVAIESTKQLESQMLMRHYKGFLK